MGNIADSLKAALALGIWACRTIQWFAWRTTKQQLPSTQFPMSKATFIESAI